MSNQQRLAAAAITPGMDVERNGTLLTTTRPSPNSELMWDLESSDGQRWAMYALDVLTFVVDTPAALAA